MKGIQKTELDTFFDDEEEFPDKCKHQWMRTKYFRIFCSPFRRIMQYNKMVSAKAKKRHQCQNMERQPKNNDLQGLPLSKHSQLLRLYKRIDSDGSMEV